MLSEINEFVATVLFTVLGYQVSLLEFSAVIASAIGVWLGTTGKRIMWPWWGLSSALYGWLFLNYELYASAVLQVAFIVAALCKFSQFILDFTRSHFEPGYRHLVSDNSILDKSGGRSRTTGRVRLGV